MDPQAVSVQAQGIVGILVSLIVDGKGRQVGKVPPVLFREWRQVALRRRGGQAQPQRIGVDGAVPVAQLEQQGMGRFGRLGAAQLAQELAPGDALQGEVFYLSQVRGILRQDLASAHAHHERGLDPLLLGPGLAVGPFPGYLLGGAGLHLPRRPAEKEPIVHQLPGRPGCRRCKIPVGQLGQLGERGRGAGKQFPRGLYLAGLRLKLVQAVERAGMESHDILETHAQAIAAFQFDLQLFAHPCYTRGPGLVQNQAVLAHGISFRPWLDRQGPRSRVPACPLTGV